MRLSRLSYLASIVGVLSAVVVGACSSDPAAPTDAGAGDVSTTVDSSIPPTDSAIPPTDSAIQETSTPTDAPADSAVFVCSAVAAGAACNTVVNGGSVVALTQVAMAFPTGTGGTIADGRYFLTGINAYTGSPVPATTTLRQTLEVCGGATSLHLVGDEDGAKRQSFTLAPSGTSPNATRVCSSVEAGGGGGYSSYTATPTTLTFYVASFGIGFIYTKQ